MTTISEHKKNIQEFLDDINEKIRANLLVERQKIVGFAASEAAVNLFAVLLHAHHLVEPGFAVNHRYFASEKIAESRFSFPIPKKKELLSLLVGQEQYRNELCYGRAKEAALVNSAVKNLYALKRIIDELVGDLHGK